MSSQVLSASDKDMLIKACPNDRPTLTLVESLCSSDSAAEKRQVHARQPVVPWFVSEGLVSNLKGSHTTRKHRTTCEMDSTVKLAPCSLY